MPDVAGTSIPVIPDPRDFHISKIHGHSITNIAARPGSEERCPNLQVAPPSWRLSARLLLQGQDMGLVERLAVVAQLGEFIEQHAAIFLAMDLTEDDGTHFLE